MTKQTKRYGWGTQDHIVKYDLTTEEKLEAVQGRSLFYTYFCPNHGVCHLEWSHADWAQWIDLRGSWIHKETDIEYRP